MWNPLLEPFSIKTWILKLMQAVHVQIEHHLFGWSLRKTNVLAQRLILIYQLKIPCEFWLALEKINLCVLI